PSWLALTPQPARGVNAGAITVTVTRSDLTPGWYYGDITISDPRAGNDPVLIPVSYRVYQPRALSIGADTLRLKVTFKRPAVVVSVPVLNGGESFGPGIISWSAATVTPWLRLHDASGMEGEALSLHIDAMTRSPGTYTGEIVLDGNNSVTGAPIGNAPLRVPVILEVEAREQLLFSAATVPAGSSVTFTNALGHRIAVLDVTEGTVEGLTLQLYPYTLPRNIHRLRYACRHYIIAASGSYRAQLTLFHTLSERVPAAISDAEALRLWRQSPAQFQWTPTAGYATAMEQSVTGSDLSDLNGIWTMASPLSPQQYVSNLRVTRLTHEKTELSWTEQGSATGSGYIIERNIEGTQTWQSIGMQTHSRFGEYRFTDEDANTGDLRYRLLSFDSTGNARQSQEVTLPAMTILTSETVVQRRLTLDQNVPNPASAAKGHGTIRFSLPTAGNVHLALYDGSGRLVSILADGVYGAGSHTVRLPLAGLAAGMYLYRLHCDAGTCTRTMIVTR
ncbi:MAG: T9SS type A sorting domain-containing protein, partial [Bacteroidetes bacterium]|nr:T9SS type A sorting domain-containing protein [Bacteroidota bacterium]